MKDFRVQTAFFAEKKQIVDISYPGDIVGLHDTGILKLVTHSPKESTLIIKEFQAFRPTF